MENIMIIKHTTWDMLKLLYEKNKHKDIELELYGKQIYNSLDNELINGDIFIDGITHDEYGYEYNRFITKSLKEVVNSDKYHRIIINDSVLFSDTIHLSILRKVAKQVPYFVEQYCDNICQNNGILTDVLSGNSSSQHLSETVISWVGTDKQRFSLLALYFILAKSGV